MNKMNIEHLKKCDLYEIHELTWLLKRYPKDQLIEIINVISEMLMSIDEIVGEDDDQDIGRVEKANSILKEFTKG